MNIKLYKQMWWLLLPLHSLVFNQFYLQQVLPLHVLEIGDFKAAHGLLPTVDTAAAAAAS